MASPHHFLAMAFLSSCFFILHAASAAAPQYAPVSAAYFLNGQGQAAADFDATPFTHLFYAFALLDSTTYNVVPEPGDDGAIASFSSTVRKSNPAVKTLLSIGGSVAGPTAFSTMAATSATRASFINQSIAAARSYGYDGLDLDWEFPQSDTDMANLGLLFAEWRSAVSKENPKTPLLLTAAVKFNVTVAFGGAGTYPVDSIAQNLNWVNVMSYDLHGGWETVTGEHTALYDATSLQTLTVNFGIQHWLSAGLPPYRATLGLAAYGHLWYLADPSQHGIGAPSSGPPLPDSTFTQIELAVSTYNGKCIDDVTTRAAYCYWNDTSSNPTQAIWAGFDDASTIATKVRYLKSLQLRGYSFWSVGGDTRGVLFKRASRTLNGTR